MNYLGIDYGDKHIGIAQSSGTIATGLLSVPTAEAISRIKQLVEKNDIDCCVIGLPSGSMKKQVEAFSKQLHTAIPIKIILWDETLSSFSARESLSATNLSTKNRKNKEHQVAAAAILQSYLDSL